MTQDEFDCWSRLDMNAKDVYKWLYRLSSNVSKDIFKFDAGWLQMLRMDFKFDTG